MRCPHVESFSPNPIGWEALQFLDRDRRGKILSLYRFLIEWGGTKFRSGLPFQIDKIGFLKFESELDRKLNNRI